MAALALTVAAEYTIIAVAIVPRLARIASVERTVRRAARWAATAFFAGCAVTHLVIALDNLVPSQSDAAVMDTALRSTTVMLLKMVLPLLAQILGGGALIWISRTHLEVKITSKTRAAEARESDQQLRSALDDAPVGIAFSVAANETRYVNPAFLQILGFDSDTRRPLAATVLALLHPADRAAAVSALSRVEAGERIEIEFRIVRTDGGVRWIHLRRSPVSSTSGRATTLVEDITDRIDAHAEVAASERRFTQIANSVGVGINLRQLHPPMLLWANAAYTHIVGSDLRQESTAEDPAHVLVHPDDHQAVMDQYWPRAQSGEVAEVEFRVLRRDGQIRWVHLTSNPVIHDNGSIAQVAGTVEDITARKLSERILIDERRRLRQAESIGRVGSWERDLESGAISWSAGMFELWGIDGATFDGDYAAAREQIHLDDRPALDAAVTACVDTGLPFQLRYRIYRAGTGDLCWINVHGEAADRDGKRVRIGGSIADVTGQVLADENAATARAFQHAVFKASPDIIAVWDFETQSTAWANRSAASDLGYSSADVEKMNGNVARHLVHPDDQARFFQAARTVRNSPDDSVLHIDYRMLHKDGTFRWFSRRTAPLRRAGNGQVVQVVGVIRDITTRKATELELRHTALHDVLTGLPNRSLLLDRISSAIARAERENTEVGVLFCDLDGFKGINDTGGHAAGDAVLVAVSQRLRLSVRKSDSIARVGGDEFVVILEPSQGPRKVPGPRRAPDDSTVQTAAAPPNMRDAAELVADRIRSNLTAPVLYDGQPYAVSISIGVTLAGPGSNAEDVLRDADTAMYVAKHHGRDRFEVFNSGRQPRRESVYSLARQSAPTSVDADQVWPW